MKPLLVAGVLALLPLAAPAQNLYRCTEGGVIRYADRPCGKSAVLVSGQPAAARPETVVQPAPAPTAAAPAPPPAADAQAMRQAQLAQMARERRIREVEYELRDAERELDDDLNRLRRRQGTAANNLAGATWIGGIAQEMQAVTAKGNARIDALRRELFDLRAGR